VLDNLVMLEFHLRSGLSGVIRWRLTGVTWGMLL
jgi:hypothetical protein